jgi:DNA-binding CsgD family transcriptional regulator
MVSSALLDMLPLGIMVLNRQAKILFANIWATDLLRTGGDLNVVDGVFCARSIPHSRALSDALHRLACTETHEPVGFNIARTDHRPLSIVLAKLPARSKAFDTPGKCRIAVFLSDPEFNHRPSAALVRDLFEFTPVESSIAILMMESFDTGAVAGELAITRNTLRDHLKSMFFKTRTRNQGELLHILLRCPAGLRFPSPH